MKTREQRRKEFIDQNQPEWQATGAKFKKARLKAKIRFHEISEHSGFSSGKLSSFERGESMYHRRAVERAYINTIQARIESAKKALEDLAV